MIGSNTKAFRNLSVRFNPCNCAKLLWRKIVIYLTIRQKKYFFCNKNLFSNIQTISSLQDDLLICLKVLSSVCLPIIIETWKKNGQHFADDIHKYISLKQTFYIWGASFTKTCTRKWWTGKWVTRHQRVNYFHVLFYIDAYHMGWPRSVLTWSILFVTSSGIGWAISQHGKPRGLGPICSSAAEALINFREIQVQ